MFRFFLLFGFATFLASCDPNADDGPVDVAIVGEADGLFQDGVRLSLAGQHMRAATHEGLVAFDATGQVVPAIAERWIVTDDGLSYIFRLRDSNWPDGESISAADVRILLQDRVRRLDGTSLGLDLEKLTEIRAMAGRVVELRLSGPMPEFLRLLAQPELGLMYEGAGAGPMTLSREEDSDLVRLNAMPPQERGLPRLTDWAELTRDLSVRGMSVSEATNAFSSGQVDLLLNGTISDFPMAQLGPLSRGNVQVDPAIGLLGLIFKSDEGLLADTARREALSMAIDRNELIAPFSLGGWQPTSWIVPPEHFAPYNLPVSRWEGLTIEERRRIASQRIGLWKATNDGEAIVRVGLPDGPGSDLLFRQISRAWQPIGIETVRVGMDENADLELHDRLARYSSPRWFLNQFNCSLDVGLCSQAADEIVAETLELKDAPSKQAGLFEAHSELVASEVFIPLGAPVRWSLVRGSVDGYQPNPWGLHPLFSLASPTT